jgi:hypothetical protein
MYKAEPSALDEPFASRRPEITPERLVKKLAALIVVALGCRTVPAGPMFGATTPRGAVEQMLSAAKAQDLQAITAVFGDETGLVRDRESRETVEQRAFIIACILKADTQKIAEPMAAGNGRVSINVDLTQGTNSGSTRFETARAKDGRWLVANMDLPALQNKGFCKRPG